MKRSAPISPPTKRRWRSVVGAVALGLAAASCGTSDATATSPGTEQATGRTALVSTAAGGQLDLGALEGTDYVLWFWAPW